MSASRHRPPIRCAHCDDVIGVYEPIVVVTGIDVRETSLAAERELTSAPGQRYHATCWVETGKPS